MSVVHASAVLMNEQAVLLMGESGSGKSSVALQLIDAHAATLIGDDRIELSRTGDGIMVAPHAELCGLIEMRGLGLLRVPFCDTAPLALVIELVTAEEAPRLADNLFYTHDGVTLPLLKLHGHDPNTPMKIKLALSAVSGLADGFRDDAIYPLSEA